MYVVDDEISIRESLEPLIRSAGRTPRAFASALEFPRPQAELRAELPRARFLLPRIFNAWEWIARYFVNRAAIASLRELDDRALWDIGLARSQIEAAVHGRFQPGEDMMITSSAALDAAIGLRANGRGLAATVETAPWS